MSIKLRRVLFFLFLRFATSSEIFVLFLVLKEMSGKCLRSLIETSCRGVGAGCWEVMFLNGEESFSSHRLTKNVRRIFLGTF